MTVKVNLPNLDTLIPPNVREKILRALAIDLKGRIERRTGKGIDVDGKSFAPYSKRYAAQRLRAGRGTPHPTLRLGGGMLSSMKILKLNSEEAVLGFEGSSAALKFGKRKRAVKDSKTGSKVKSSAQETTRRVPNSLKAQWNDKGEGRVPARHFFGASEEDRRALTALATRILRDHLRGRRR